MNDEWSRVGGRKEAREIERERESESRSQSSGRGSELSTLTLRPNCYSVSFPGTFHFRFCYSSRKRTAIAPRTGVGWGGVGEGCSEVCQGQG